MFFLFYVIVGFIVCVLTTAAFAQSLGDKLNSEDWLMSTMLGVIAGMIWLPFLPFVIAFFVIKYLAQLVIGERKLPSFENRKLIKREAALEAKIARKRHIAELERELGIDNW